MKKLLFALSFITILLISCKDDDTSPQIQVLTAGAIDHGRSVSWTNESIKDVGDAVTVIKCGFVDGSDIYLAGHIETKDGKDLKPTVWKNGTPTTLSDDGSIETIFVSQGIVYCGGYRYTHDDKNEYVTPTYWVDEDYSFIHEIQAKVTSITVIDNKVYVLGSYYNKTFFWDNPFGGEFLEGGENFVATGSFAKNDQLHIVGNGSDGGYYWTNKQATKLELSDKMLSSKANAVYVDGSDVYVVGNQKKGAGDDDIVATYWKNGKPVVLSDGGEAVGLKVNNGDVYVLGYRYQSNGVLQVPAYWINGMQHALLEINNDVPYQAFDFSISK